VSTTSNKRQLASGISVIAIAAALTVATPAYAQVEFGAIQGHVEGASAGTQVVAVDTHTGQRGSGTVNAQGDYEIFGLRPSTYTVTVQGKQPQSATVLIGQTVNVDFVSARTATGAIVVTGRRSAQPTQPQTVATNITTAQIENLPQNQRNFLSFAALAPGVQLISPSGAQQLQAGALAPQNANLLLDGISFKNPVNHGGFFGQNFGLGNPFPQIAIQEYQLQTQNFGAENGQSASALLTAITKTGGNEFHGSAFIEYQPKAFIEKGHFQTGPKPKYEREQFGGEFGGPIIPGKLTFYLAAEGTHYSLPGLTGNVTQPIPQNIAAEVNVTHPIKFDQGLYFGKLTWFATDRDTVNLSAYVRRENNPSDIDANAVASHGRTILTHENHYQAQWKHSQGDFLNFLNIAYDKATQSTPSVGTGPEYLLTQAADFNPIVQLGAHFFTQGDTEKYWVVKDDATLRHGDHTFKAGGQVTFFDLSRSVSDHFNGSYYVLNPGAIPTFDITTAAPYGARINTQPTSTISGKDTQVGLYISDEWKPDIHWTVNAGLRWDFESNANNKNYVTPAAIATALRNYPGWAARGIDPEDYISNGHNRKPFYGAFQPRLGISYDVHGDRDLVLFGGAGRYYDRSLFIEGVIESLTNSNNVVTVGGTGSAFATACASASPPAYCHDPEALRTFLQGQGTGGSVWVLPNKLKLPYSDQLDLGVRKRFGDITATLTYSHVESHHLFMFARANFFENGWFTRVLQRDAAGNVTGCTNGGDAWIWDNVSSSLPGVPASVCPAQNGQLPGFSGKLNRGLDNGKARLDAIYLQIEKPFTDTSRWGFTEAVTLQRARSNVAQELNSDEFYNGTGFGVYGWNYVNGVEKWRSVTSANWRAPWGITLSGILTLSSGPSFGHIQAPWNSSISFPDSSGGGSAIIYGNLGGVYWPKQDIGYKRLDLRVAKTFKMPWGHELTADFAAFNVFNWLNRNYPSWDAGGGDNPPRTFNQQVSNDQREFQVGLKYKF
jgi:hypothetical protein